MTSPPASTADTRYVMQGKEHGTCPECGEALPMPWTIECPDCGTCSCPYHHPDGERCSSTFSSTKSVKNHHWQIHDVKLAQYDRCDYCTNWYELEYTDQRFCSPECSSKDQSNDPSPPESESCFTCGETFEVEATVDGKRVYCPDCSDHSVKAGYVSCTFCSETYLENSDRDDRLSEQAVCSVPCYEEKTTKRPDDLYQLLYVLYVHEDRSIASVSRRHPDLQYTAIQNRLEEFGLYQKSMESVLREFDASKIGSSAPDGDDSYKQYYPDGRSAGGDD